MGCSVFGCSGHLHCGGLCSRHYNRLRTTGAVEDGPRARLSLASRFWKHVDKRGPDECWPWVSGVGGHGYGLIGLGGRKGGKEAAHRVSWRLHFGEIPSRGGYHGGVIMHTCDNRRCVNPAHLRLGTQLDNIADMVAKRRHRPRGMRCD